MDADTPVDDTAARRKTKTPGQRRKTRAELEADLATKRCKHCLSVGCWHVTSTQERIRYLRCTACGKSDQTAV